MATTGDDTSDAEWEALQEAIGGQVVLPESPDYARARKPKMPRFHHVLPAAVVFCRSPADVSATIAFAKGHGLPVAIRSGGHSVAGRSSTEGLVIDVSPMDAVMVADGATTVGAGVRLGGLDDALEPYGLTVPAGSSHSVGIAGLALGGGIGMLGRKHGLTCDHLRRADVVLADGRTVGCDEQENADLFWSLRGAGGGNFGVVTSLVFGTVTAPMITAFHLVWSFDHADALIDAWQAWAPCGPDELDATLRLSATGGGERPPLVDLSGAVVGTDTDAAELLDELVARAGAEPASASLRTVPYREARRYLDGVRPADDWGQNAPPPPPTAAGHLFTRSEFFRRRLPRPMIDALVKSFSRGLVRGHERELAFIPWGGAYNRVAADDTAFVHRDELLIVQHLLTVDPETTQVPKVDDWLARSWGLVHPWGTGGVYPNFPDPELQQWSHAYFGKNRERLLQIKAKYDPDGFFGIPLRVPR